MAIIRTPDGRRRFVNMERLTESFPDPGAGAIDPDDYLYRSSSLNYRRDMLAVTQQRSLDVAFSVYQQNPLGNRIIRLNQAYVVGDGITYMCSNPDVERIVEEFWNDDVNDMDRRTYDWAGELSVYGELIPEALVGDVSGVVRFGYIDPYQVKDVRHVTGNPLVPDLVVLKSSAGMDPSESARSLPIIRERVMADQSLALDGQVWYFKINSVSNSTRGWSDLLHLADWLDSYNEVLWDIMERSRLLRTFVWDVSIKGADDHILREWNATHRDTPRTGSVRVHNDGEVWSAVAPTLNASDSKTDRDIILEHIAGGSGFPKTWLSSSEDVNRAAAIEMGGPSERTIAARQRIYVRMIHKILRFALAKAAESGRLVVDGDGKVPVYGEDGNETGDTDYPDKLIQLNAPEPVHEDLQSMGTNFFAIVQGLAIAEQQGWFGPNNIRQVLAIALSKLGYDYDPANAPEGEQVTADSATVGVDGAGNPIPAAALTEPPSRKAVEAVGRMLAGKK